MKKLILVGLLALLGVLSARAYDFEVDGIYYNITNSDTKEVEVTYKREYQDSYSGSVVISSTVTYEGTTYTVTSIGNQAFYGCSGLTSVTIPESVTAIGGAAFQNSRSLTTVTIPESVTAIGGGAFYGTAINSPLYNSKVFAYMSPTYSGAYAIPSGIQSISGWAFYQCKNLTSVTIPNSVTYIGESAFSNCSGLTSVTLPESVDTIRNETFWGCSGLTTVTIPNSVTYIGSAFSRCSGLTTVTIPNSVTYIGRSAFSECSRLTTLTIPESVDTIRDWTFSDCSGLTTVTIPNSVTYIGERAFLRCSGLTMVTIPNSVTYIGESAFSNCSGLTSVTIPERVDTIRDGTFSGCSGLTTVTLPNSVTYIGERAFLSCSGLTTVTIPNSVTYIGERAFLSCSGLTTVTIPNSVTYIGERAFSGCSGLTSMEWNAVACQDFKYSSNDGAKPPFYDCENITSITFGNQVEHIPAYLCYGMDKLTSVTIHATSIGEEAFYNCKGLRSVTLSAGVTSIGSNVFGDCDGLISVTSLAKLPPYCEEENVFGGESSEYYQTLYVPRGCKSAYASAKEWHKFSKIEEIETYTVTVLTNDASMGRVTGGGDYKIDEKITLVAIPNTGYHFVKWDDENTDNPRTLTVTADITLTAVFAKDEENPDIPGDTTANENPEADNFRIYVQDRTIYLSEERGLVQVYNMAGQCVYNGRATAIPVQRSGLYILVAGSQRLKVLVK